ncbi:uncharacterized protein [Linepithema humile]|uniref:uncharacterized protein isoform X2 n=1 Tax=Linepithema humile TaxID=83485 RepID=UPI00351E830A
MYALVKYTDVYYVCNSKYITRKKGETKVTYKDGCRYPASVIVKHDNKILLEEAKRNIVIGKPCVLLNKPLEILNNENNESTSPIRNTHTSNTREESLTFEDIEVLDSDISLSNLLDRSIPLNLNCGKRLTFDSFGTVSENACISKCDNVSLKCNEANVDAISLPLEMMVPENVCISTNCANVNQMCNEENINVISLPLEEMTVQENECIFTNCDNVSQMCNEEYVDAISLPLEELIAPENVCIPFTCDNVSQMCNEGNVGDPEPSLDVETDNQSSTSEYIPSDYISENEQNSDYELQEQKSTSKNLQEQKSTLNKTVSSISSLDNSQICSSACNDELMHVETSNIKTSRKKSYCIFCTKLQSQFARHLEKVHCNEPDVKKFSVLPKGNPERKKIIETLRKNGNFKFNTDSKLNDGQLIVCRRPNEKRNKCATDFIACAKCKGFFAKSTIRHHSRKCFKKDFKKNKCIMVLGRKISSRLHTSANSILRKTVFPVMREDEVTRLIRYDELLIIYANNLCIKYKSQHHHDMIRARLRVLGRFLIALKETNKNIENFESLYHPKFYDDCICAINTVARYNDENQMYEAPAVAANLSTLIKQIGNLLITKCIKTGDTEKKIQVKDFLKLWIVDIAISVNRTVMETQSTHKRRKTINLPSLEDIKKLYLHLKEKRVKAFKALQQSFSYIHWLSLAETTLTSVHVFNRRRAGEIERILIEDFKNHEKLNKNMYSDIYKSLSDKHKKIAEKYVRFCIRGKLGRTVPVLLTKDLFQCIILILKFRKEAEVPDKNPYIFGLPGISKRRYKYLRACVLMRRFANECNAMDSTTLRGTILRKHVATYCIQLNLNDIDVSDLATFMGHSDKIHKDHYRQPLPSRDILKISQYLEAVQGKVHGSNDESSDSNMENNENLKDYSRNSSLIDMIDMVDDDMIDNDMIDNDMNKENMSFDTSVHHTSDDLIIHKQSNESNKQDTNKKQKRSTSPYGKTKRTRWSQKEKKTALETFSQYMKDLKLPSLREIQTIKKQYNILSNRTSPQIKTWLHNQQKALRQ